MGNNIKSVLGNFSAITFRESSVVSALRKEIRYSYPIVLDPTLLTQTQDWGKNINRKWKKTVCIFYDLRTVKDKRGHLLDFAKRLAYRSNFEFIDFSTMKYSPADFVSAIKYARCVIISLFHAIAFSLIFNKRLYPIALNDRHDGRYTDLLQKLWVEILFSI